MNDSFPSCPQTGGGSVRYTITPANPSAHLFRVTCVVSEPLRSGQRFSLPVWTPGSYMIREFSRNIVTIHAHCGDKSVRLTKLDKNTWQAGTLPGKQPLEIEYDVYAWDLSVRAAHLDRTHGFFNGSSVFLAAEGQTEQPCLLDIRAPEAGTVLGTWRVATALVCAVGEKGGAARQGFGLYRAESYDELIDSPVELGDFTFTQFDAHGVTHDIALTGRHDCDLERLCADLEKICAWHIDLFGMPAPVQRYLFLVMLTGNGYGGLEHRASTALLASRADLPYTGMRTLTEGYKSFLGLCSHEYFHTWHVKRIKPAAFMPYDLGRENYTQLLWAFEGMTSYYDDLALVRSGVIGVDDYLALLAKNISSVLRGAGRFKQSVAESSFDAWTKYYRQDENAPNAIVSYYAKGALIALALDLQLRALSAGRYSLDDVMRELWQRYGQPGIGVGEQDIFTLLADVGERAAQGAGRKLSAWLEKAVSGTDDVPLARLLKPFGVTLKLSAEKEGAATLGVKLATGENGVLLSRVYDDGPAQRAGLSAGDVLLACNGLRVTSANWHALLARHQPGEQIELYAFRRDELMRFNITLAEAPALEASLSCSDSHAAARRLRKGWLGR